MFLTDEEETWVLDYLLSGKGMIPYQMITEFESLNIRQKNGFFDRKDFYSTLKEKDISETEYENVKKFFTLLRLKALGDMNRVYNFQGTLILCEISEQRASLLEKLLNLIQENGTALACFLVMSIEIKANVTLPCQQMQKRSEFLRKL